MSAIVVIGSGTSLNDVDLRRLAGLPTLAFNRSYMAWDSWPFRPTYFACLDPLAVAAIGADLRLAVDGRVMSFLDRSARGCHLPGDRGDVRYCETSSAHTPAARIDRLHDFGNVGATSLQIVAALGFATAIMVGFDGFYSHPGGASVTAGHHDPDHFRSDYRRGVPVVTRDLATFTAGWPSAASFCREAGLSVINASTRSAIDVFPRCSLDEALVKQRVSAP